MTTAMTARTRERVERIEQKMRLRYAEATTERERLAVALDYARAAAAFSGRRDLARTDAVLHGLVRTLLRAGDELLRIPGGRR